MKLNNKFLAVRYETEPLLKEYYLKEHLSTRNRLLAPEEAWWEQRVEIAKNLTYSPNNYKIYYLSRKAQEEASMIKFDKIDLKWFEQVPDGHYMYVVGVGDFYRFYKEKGRINVLNYFITDKDGYNLWYDGYSILLDKGEMAMLPSQDKERGRRFVQMLLYVELGDITVKKIKVGDKVKYGSTHDEQIFNDTDLKNVYLVTSNWNKIVLVEGGFKVRGHFRVQPCGVGRTQYKIVWVREYEKGSFVRMQGKQD
jgi:hypothetical protein